MYSSFVEALPQKVRCTNDFEIYGTRFRSKDKALECMYVELNQIYKKFIALDLDKPGAAYQWDDLGLPAPTYIVINPENGHCHYLYELNTPVYYTEASRRTPQKYLENTDIALTNLMGADLRYVGKFTKNPLHPHWLTIYHNVRYDLEDFKEWGVDLRGHKRKLLTLDDLEGRNTTLFNTLRHWAYIQVKQSDSYAVFQQLVEDQALSINQGFVDCSKGVLPAKEVLSTARSVGTWTWRHRDTIGNGTKNRGVMQLPSDMSTKAKQAAGAAYAHANTTAKQSTRQTVLEAAIALKAAGLPITQYSVATRADVSARTVKKYWSEVDAQLGLYKKAA
ncbi:replication initiation protein [Ralstonia pseudosolanacearum]